MFKVHLGYLCIYGFFIRMREIFGYKRSTSLIIIIDPNLRKYIEVMETFPS